MTNKPLDRPERAHPAHEDTTPPPAERRVGGAPVLPRVPAAPRVTDEELARQQGTRRESTPDTDREAPAPTPSAWTPQNVIPLVVALGGVITGIIGSMSGMTKDQAKKISEDTAAIREEIKSVRTYLVAKHEAESVRWEIVATILCKTNGDQSFVRGIRCDELLSLDPPPLGQTAPWKITNSTRWPELPLPPHPPTN